MFFRKLSLFLFLFIFYSSIAQEKVELLDSLMVTTHNRGIFNGNVLVTEEEKLIYRNELGRADAAGRKDLTADMAFNLGSVSKQFSAVGLMLLQEQGKLELENRVSEYLPQLPAWAEEIHIEHLLDYSSGLPKEDDEIPGDEAAWKVLDNLPELEAPPGTKYIYSNFNIFLRKRIIERITEMSYEDFLKRTFFIPLKMESAIVDPGPAAQDMAKAFDTRFTPDVYKPFLSGQVSMNIDDLQKWVFNLHSGNVISEDSLLRLFQGMENGNSALGQGIFEDGKLKIHWHSGSSYNFQSSLAFFPETNHTILLMTNQKNMNEGDITNAIYDILKGQSFELPKRPLYLDIRTTAFYDGYESAISLFKKVKKDVSYDLSNPEESLTRAAEFLLRRGKNEDAFGLLEFTLKTYPESEKAKMILAESRDLQQGS